MNKCISPKKRHLCGTRGSSEVSGRGHPKDSAMQTGINQRIIEMTRTFRSTSHGTLKCDLQRIEHAGHPKTLYWRSLERCGVICSSKKCSRLFDRPLDPPMPWRPSVLILPRSVQEVNPSGGRPQIENLQLRHKRGAIIFKFSRLWCARTRVLTLLAEKSIHHQWWQESASNRNECEKRMQKLLLHHAWTRLEVPRKHSESDLASKDGNDLPLHHHNWAMTET